MEILTSTYKDKITGTLSCFDRIIITGTVPQICYAQGMTSYLYSHNIRIFDYARFAEPLKEQIRSNAEGIAKENDIEIEFVRKTHIRKEDLVKKVLDKRGYHPGIVHILSAMEGCETYKPWHDKRTGKTFLKPAQGKCLHYYFYFIDPYLGYGYIRVPTWAPFRLQIYINGHNILANELDKENLRYTMLDNAFDHIEDFERAQKISDEVDIKKVHKCLDILSNKYCPVISGFNQVYHWSIMQAEYATDIIFRKQSDLKAIYSELVTTTAIHTVKPDNIATFLGHKVAPQYQGEIGNNYNIRIEGSRIKHTMGKSSIKMYDKFSKILRIETTTNDISFFKHYREVEHKNGTKSMKYAPLKKNIYSLVPLSVLFKASNKRYLEFISAFDNKEIGRKRLEKLSATKKENNRNYKGFNLFSKEDLTLLLTILRGEFNISGFRNKDIRMRIPQFNTGKVSRLIKRLKVFKLIKKAGKTYKYYLTRLGKEVLIIAERLKETVFIPALNY